MSPKFGSLPIGRSIVEQVSVSVEKMVSGQSLAQKQTGSSTGCTINTGYSNVFVFRS